MNARTLHSRHKPFRRALYERTKNDLKKPLISVSNGDISSSFKVLGDVEERLEDMYIKLRSTSKKTKTSRESELESSLFSVNGCSFVKQKQREHFKSLTQSIHANDSAKFVSNLVQDNSSNPATKRNIEDQKDEIFLKLDLMFKQRMENKGLTSRRRFNSRQ